MPAWDSLLFRDSLNDVGTVPSPGYGYLSPDIICHAQVASPQSYFAANYTQDPNQAIVSGNFNYVYVRTKNLSTTASVGGTLQLYWCKSSLFMNVTEWVNQTIPVLSSSKTPSYDATCPVVGPGQLSIPDTPFYWNTPQNTSAYHYCLVGACFPSNKQFTMPTTNFASAADFVSWVKNYQNVAWRNLQIINAAASSYVRLDTFNNEFTEAHTAFFMINITGGSLPNGTTINLSCTAFTAPAPLNQTITVGTSTPPYSTVGYSCPAGFTGGVQTKVNLPAGQSWPAGVTIETKAYFTPPMSDVTDEIRSYATPWASLAIDPTDHKLSENAVLLEVGSSSAEVIS